MRLYQTGLLCIQNIRRGRRTFLLSVFGIAVGISVLAFFLSLSLGVKYRILLQIFPPGRLEVVPPKVLALPLTDEVIKQLQQNPNVQVVYPRNKIAFPIHGWPGPELQQLLNGKDPGFEMSMDGIEPDLMPEMKPTEKKEDLRQKKDRVWKYFEKNKYLPFEDLYDLREASFPCKKPMFWNWKTNFCEMPTPMLVSPTMLEVYRNTVGKSTLPAVDSLGGMILITTQLLGKTVESRLKDRSIDYPNVFMLVGYSDRAMPVGWTVPIAYVRRWNAQFVSKTAGQEYTSLSIQVKPTGDVTAVVTQIEALGYEIQDNGAKTAGLAVTVVTAIFVLVSAAILLVAIVNIMHTFFRTVVERRRELGIMRAVGASAWDVALLLLGEAVAVGVVGGVVGLVVAFLMSLGADVLIQQKAPPSLPLKAFGSVFYFSPGLCLGLMGIAVVACMLGAALPARTAARLSPSQVLSGV